MTAMTLTGAKIIFDLDEAAIAAYDVIRDRSPKGTWWPEWNLLSPEEQDLWRQSTVAALAKYDPETFGRARTELLRLWEIIGPVVNPYLAVLTRPDGT